MDRTTVVPVSATAAREAVERGYSPIPIREKDKKPAIGAWTRGTGVTEPDAIEELFTQFAEGRADAYKGIADNIGLVLGEPSDGLIDIDLDHPKTRRLKHHFLPPTPMKSGRAGRSGSHWWYKASEEADPTTGEIRSTLIGYKRYLMPKKGDQKIGDVIVEFRSSGSQSVIPPSIHPTGEEYRWEGDPWGGDKGPTVIHARKLQVQVACLALATVLLDNWPTQGSRHEAYLALAGGLLWYGDRTVHPFWETNIGALIDALAEATLDEDGGESRKSETINSTIRKIRDGDHVAGLGILATILGDDHVKQVRNLVAEVENAAGYTSRQASDLPSVDVDQALGVIASEVAATPVADRDPLEERVATWQSVDLEPYLIGSVQPPAPTVFARDDGRCLMYRGRVNMLFGNSESAKSWLALHICLQEMRENQGKVMYLDFEDEPVATVDRLRRLGAGNDDLGSRSGGRSFVYVRPEEPLSSMQRNRWGKVEETDVGKTNKQLFDRELEFQDPTLIVADGMSVLYGLHGLNTNDTVDTDVITGWLKKLTRNGRTTVIVIDHSGKGAEKGSLPIGSQHKVSMVQGTLLQVWPIKQPRRGAVGELEIVVLKDRPGQVREFSRDSGGSKAQLAAVVKMDSTKDGETVISVLDPNRSNVTGSNTQLDLQRSLDAEKAMKLSRAKSAILENVFGGDDTLILTAREIANRLARVEHLAPDEREMVANMKGSWSGWGAKALKGLTVGDNPEVLKLGTARSTRYQLALGFEVDSRTIVIADDSVDFTTVTTDGTPAVGPTMTVTPTGLD